MPSSFKGKWGEITYSLRAQLTQSIWLVQKTKTEFPFVTNSEFPFGSKSEAIIIELKVQKLFLFYLFTLHHFPHQSLWHHLIIFQEQQYGSRVMFLGSGKVTMNVSSEKVGLEQGKQMQHLHATQLRCKLSMSLKQVRRWEYFCKYSTTQRAP